MKINHEKKEECEDELGKTQSSFPEEQAKRFQEINEKAAAAASNMVGGAVGNLNLGTE